MSDIKQDQHPSSLTEDQKAALRAEDPAAYDDQNEEAEGATQPGEGQGEGAAAAPAEGGEAGAAQAGEGDGEGEAGAGAGAGEGGEAADGADKGPQFIPKGRFNEALRKASTLEARVQELEAENLALKNGPPVDYDEEIKKLDANWNGDGDDAFEGSHEEYLQQRDALLAKKVEADALARFQREQAERDAAAAGEQWGRDVQAFIEADPAHKIYGANKAIAQALSTEVQEVFAANPGMSNMELLSTAHRNLQAALRPAGPAGDAPKGPHAARDAADARAAAAASGAPAPISAGAGNRGNMPAEIDFANLKPGTFGKLDKATQAAALGGEDAL